MGRIIIRRFILGGKGNVGSLHCIVVEIDATERLLDAAQRSGSFARLQLAFPHLDHVPAHTPQLHPVPGIARLIALNLLLPEAAAKRFPCIHIFLLLSCCAPPFGARRI